MSTLSSSGPRMHLDTVTGEWRLLARFRAGQRCRCCKSYLSAGSFGLSRTLKRDYECRRCHRERCARERMQGIRGRKATPVAAVNPQAQEVRP